MKATMFIELNIKSRLGCYHRLQKNIKHALRYKAVLFTLFISYKIQKKHVVIICNSDDLRVVLLNFS